jgi:hypothetical protein
MLAAHRFRFSENPFRQAGSRLNMYDDAHQSSEAQAINEPQKVREFNSERKTLLVRFMPQRRAAPMARPNA